MPPLSRSQFEAGDTDPALAALDFLKGHPDFAFTVDEVMAALEELGETVDKAILSKGLRRLRRKQLVEARTIGPRGILSISTPGYTIPAVARGREMPITRRQFELGIDDVVEQCMRQVQSFLASRRTQAFSKKEIFAALSGHFSLKQFDTAVEKLVEVRAVEVRHVKGEPYYAYLEDLDRVW